MWLDAVRPVRATVGYGSLGVRGSLGYEGKRVSIGGHTPEHAVSSHPPAHVSYSLRGRHTRFSCRVAVNDDVPAGSTHADFEVRADGRRVAHAAAVAAGERPRPLVADVAGARILELTVRTCHWNGCHAVWLDPLLEGGSAPEWVADCLARTQIRAPEVRPQAERCIATIASAGFEPLLDDLLGSLAANGRCADALLVVMLVDADERCRNVAARHDAYVIECRSVARLNATVKSALYTLPSLVDAGQFLCLDADMLVIGDLRPVFSALEASPGNTVLASREANGRGLRDLRHALELVYGGRETDFARVLGRTAGEPEYPLVVNDGAFAGSRAALLAVDDVIRSWSGAPRWVDERQDVWWRNQFIFNLALARLRCGMELDSLYNVQLDCQEVDFLGDGWQAFWKGRPARLLHFNGRGRHKYQEHRSRFRVSG